MSESIEALMSNYGSLILFSGSKNLNSPRTSASC